MKIIPTELRGVFIIETVKYADHRGEFFRAYCENELASFIGDRRIVQINISKTSEAGAVRGMHFQHPPHAEMKLIRCLKGKVWDVAVDLRSGSATFQKWHAEELSAGNSRMMVIPEGCAHGFQVLEENSELLYLHTSAYTPEAEGAVPYNDPYLNISWPLQVTDISSRDCSHSPIDSNFNGITL